MHRIVDEATHYRMSRVRSSGSVAEVRFEMLLRKRRVRFESQRVVEGVRVDFYVPYWRLAIFIDGEFWHGRIGTEGLDAFWQAKIERNVKRDALQRRRLRRQGHAVVRFWALDVLRHPDRVLARLNRLTL